MAEREKSIKLHIEGGNVSGDLLVSGFVTWSTAFRVAARFADGLRLEFPGAVVTVEEASAPAGAEREG